MFEDFAKKIAQALIIPVVKVDVVEDALSIAAALSEGGIGAIEITFRTKEGESGYKKIAECIRAVREAMPDMLVGAGTVINAEHALGLDMNHIIRRHRPVIGIFVVRNAIEAEQLFAVPRESFYPSPKVDSAVIRITLHKERPWQIADEALFFRIVKAGFSQRRKQLGGVLASPDGQDLGKEDVVSLNPDVIFVVYMPYSGDDPDEVREEKLAVINDDEAFQSLDAVKNGRVVPIMLSEMYAAATRTQDGIETFAKGLYPDIDLSIE